MSTAPGRAPAPLPPQPPAKSSDAVLWIIAIVGGGFIVLVVGGLLLAGLVIKRVHVNESGKQVEIETPAGALRMNSDERHATGLPVYPGAKPIKTEGGAVEFAQEDGDGVTLASEQYLASDDLEQVSQWYEENLGSNYRREGHGSGSPLAHTSSDADVAFVNEKGDISRIVALKKKPVGVEINLLRVGKKEVQ